MRPVVFQTDINQFLLRLKFDFLLMYMHIPCIHVSVFPLRKPSRDTWSGFDSKKKQKDQTDKVMSGTKYKGVNERINECKKKKARDAWMDDKRKVESLVLHFQ